MIFNDSPQFFQTNGGIARTLKQITIVLPNPYLPIIQDHLPVSLDAT